VQFPLHALLENEVVEIDGLFGWGVAPHRRSAGRARPRREEAGEIVGLLGLSGEPLMAVMGSAVVLMFSKRPLVAFVGFSFATYSAAASCSSAAVSAT